MSKNAPTVIAVLAAAALIGFALYGRSDSVAGLASVPEGAQVIEISAKGGYEPASQIAKAGVPTVLRVKTDGAYDCSTALRIPSLRVSKQLPPTGETLIDLGTQQAGTLRGTCSMGMYSFAIDFQA
jgi:plastocyanin domain-containing protein